MFVPFLIMLREGLEAALIVSLIASYLKRTQRGRWIGVMWIGVFLAAALCLGLGIFINETTGEFPQKEQELFEAFAAGTVAAIGLPTAGELSRLGIKVDVMPEKFTFEAMLCMLKELG